MSADSEEAVASSAAAYLDCGAITEDLAALCDIAAQLCEAPLAMIELVHDGCAYQAAVYGADASAEDAEAPDGEPPLSAVIMARGEDVYLEDVAADPLIATLLRADGRLGAGHMFAAAVIREPRPLASRYREAESSVWSPLTAGPRDLKKPSASPPTTCGMRSPSRTPAPAQNQWSEWVTTSGRLPCTMPLYMTPSSSCSGRCGPPRRYVRHWVVAESPAAARGSGASL